MQSWIGTLASPERRLGKVPLPGLMRYDVIEVLDYQSVDGHLEV